VLALYNILGSHLSVRDEILDQNVAQLDIIIRNAELIKILILVERGDKEELEDRMRNTMENIGITINRLRGMNILEREYQCNYRALYEVSMMGLKNKLMEVQARMKWDKDRARDYCVNRVDYMAGQFGTFSVQAEDCRKELLRFDDMDLKNRAGKFKEFL
jgi:hypothetical protein